MAHAKYSALMQPPRLTGLIAATHTPFAPDGSLDLSGVERQAAHLLRHGVKRAFIAGSTGESHSLSLNERLQLAQRWFEVTRRSELEVIVHVGSNCLEDARALAAQAQELGAAAISALAPSYFKPANIEALVNCCRRIAEVAPETPFYFYDIPALTGVQLSMPEFLTRAAGSIPNLAGLKFTNLDLMSLQLCQAVEDGRVDLLWGYDEALLAGLAFGLKGAVGSTYNFAAPIYHRLMAAFHRGDFESARREQRRSAQLVRVLVRRGFIPSCKALMGMLGVEVGPARLPNATLTTEQFLSLRQDLTELGFFDWL
jgi:N-acetylneuraminate lyase